MKYNTIDIIENIITKEKKSKFIGYAYPVEAEQEVKERLEHIKKLHEKATHHCYAYRMGLDKNNYRANDDGEPSGTAGKPILNQIDSFGLTNCLVVVVRYFGGTKLGVSGLVDAYKICAKETLAAANIITKDITEKITFKTDFISANNIFDFLNKNRIPFTKNITDTHIYFEINVEKERTDRVREFLFMVLGS
jgi:uncharacterized YigZ family protein